MISQAAVLTTKRIALSGVTRHGDVCATLNVAKHAFIK